MSEKCECPICKRHNFFDGLLERYKFTKKDKLFLEGLVESLMYAEDEAEYRRLILQGTWPQSVWILERALERARRIHDERTGKDTNR